MIDDFSGDRERTVRAGNISPLSNENDNEVQTVYHFHEHKDEYSH